MSGGAGSAEMSIETAVLSLADHYPDHADIEIVPMSDKGEGVVAKSDIKQGSFVTAYAGLIIKNKVETHEGYKILLGIGQYESVFFDGFIVRHMLNKGVAVPKSLLGSIINSSRDNPDTSNVAWRLEDDDRENPKRKDALKHITTVNGIEVATLEFYATKDIPAGTELMFEYVYLENCPLEQTFIVPKGGGGGGGGAKKRKRITLTQVESAKQFNLLFI